jgi:hypothetical protein
VSRRGVGNRTLLATAAAGKRACLRCALPLRSDNRNADQLCGYCQAGVDPAAHRAAGRSRSRGERVSLRVLQTTPLLEASPAGGYGVRKTRTFSRKQLRRIVPREREVPGMELALRQVEQWRPRCRAQCVDAPRPCPFVGCKFHLFLDVTPAGGIQVNHPGLELEQLADTCALDVADRGGVTLEVVGDLLGLTRERVRQIETAGLVALRVLAEDFAP